MRRIILNGLLVGGLLVAGGAVRIHAQDAPAQTDEADALIRELGADDFKKRDEAQQKLEAMGKKALPALERAAKESPDAEIRARSNEAIARIKKGVPAPGGKRDEERQGEGRPVPPPPRPQVPAPGPRIDPNEDLEEFMKMFEGRGMRGFGKIFEDLQKQLEEFDKEFERERGGQRRPNVRVFRFGNGARSPVENKLGAVLAPPSPTLRSHLELSPTDPGLVVEELLPNSPAWRAGLKQHDVVTAIDGKPVRGPNDLAGLGDREAKVEIVRRAKKETLLVKPQGEAPAPEKAPEKKDEPVRKF